MHEAEDEIKEMADCLSARRIGGKNGDEVRIKRKVHCTSCALSNAFQMRGRNLESKIRKHFSHVIVVVVVVVVSVVVVVMVVVVVVVVVVVLALVVVVMVVVVAVVLALVVVVVVVVALVVVPVVVVVVVKVVVVVVALVVVAVVVVIVVKLVVVLVVVVSIIMIIFQNISPLSCKCKSNYFYGATAPVRSGLLSVEASRSHSDTPQSVGLLRISDQPDAETFT